MCQFLWRAISYDGIAVVDFHKSFMFVSGYENIARTILDTVREMSCDTAILDASTCQYLNHPYFTTVLEFFRSRRFVLRLVVGESGREVLKAIRFDKFAMIFGSRKTAIADALSLNRNSQTLLSNTLAESDARELSAIVSACIDDQISGPLGDWVEERGFEREWATQLILERLIENGSWDYCAR